MSEKGQEASVKTESAKSLHPVDVREHWQDAPEVPLARNDPENLITDASETKWLHDIKTLERLKVLPASHFGLESPILMRDLIDEYKKLHFLGRENAMAGLRSIAEDIKANFDPTDTLIMLDHGSVTYFYHLIEKELEGYGTIKELGRSGELEIRNRAKFAGDDPSKARKIIYIDDWVLSGEQFMKSAAQIVPKDQLFSYHLVMSDRGKFLYDKYGFNGKCIFRVNGQDDPSAFFGKFPIYGFHKIPDVLPEVFAGSAKTTSPDYSIFPDVDGAPVGRHSRLVRY